MVLEYSNDQMEENMRDNGLMENSMELEFSLQVQELKDKVNGKTGREFVG